MFEGIDGHGRRSVEPNQSLKDRQTPSLRVLCEGRNNRGSVPIGEASDSVRGLTIGLGIRQEGMEKDMGGG